MIELDNKTAQNNECRFGNYPAEKLTTNSALTFKIVPSHG